MIDNKDFPYTFDADACETCGGRCCRGSEGYVWISMEELAGMADSMKMDHSLFTNRYVRQVGGRFSLLEQRINGEHICCFFDLAACHCTIYAARPEQCRKFPFWESFRKDTSELFNECPGVRPK